jgi:dihydrolipoamide dehydrogenase
MDKFDLCVIGGGPAGYAAAMRALDFNKKVLLIEKERIGGAGLYNGALSSKAMWEFSTKYADVNFELKKKQLSYDISFEDVKKEVNAAIMERKLQLGVHLNLLRKKNKNKLFHYEKGAARLISKNEIIISKNNTDKKIYADNIIVATGSKPRKSIDIPVDEKYILTSDGIEHIEAFPRSMVVIGAGIVGCEYATIFSNFAQTKVYLIDKAERILPFEDEDLAAVVADNFEKKNVTIHRNASLYSIQIVDGMVEYKLNYKDGTKETCRVERALLSIGREPNTHNLGLEEIGVTINNKGFVIEKDTQTVIPNIYAVGDITEQIALVNVAEREARHAVVKMFGPPIKDLDYNNISTIMFLSPEVASVGLNEQNCVAKNIPYRVAKIDYSTIARAIVMRKTGGFFKLIVTDDDEMRILGLRAVGEHASSAIQAVALLIYMNKGITELGHMLHPHPSIIEGIQECARMLLGKPIYKPSIFTDKLKCYKWRDGVISDFTYKP